MEATFNILPRTLLQNEDVPVLELMLVHVRRSIYEALLVAIVLVPSGDRHDDFDRHVRELKPAYDRLCMLVDQIAASGRGTMPDRVKETKATPKC